MEARVFVPHAGTTSHAKSFPPLAKFDVALVVSGPFGASEKAQLQNSQGGERIVPRLRNEGRTAPRNREESAACVRPSFHQPGVTGPMNASIQADQAP